VKGSQVYIHNENAYIVLRRKPIYAFSKTFDAEPDMESVQMFMKWCGADHVLRDSTHFLFCETIEDVEHEAI
jgi:hypothetical protein